MSTDAVAVSRGDFAAPLQCLLEQRHRKFWAFLRPLEMIRHMRKERGTTVLRRACSRSVLRPADR